MKMLGDDVYIQRGETWSLDFSLEDPKGRPIMLPKAWKNPYIVITVTAALYKQKGDFRKSYWLDLSSLPRFVATEPLYLPDVVDDEGIKDGCYTIQDVMHTYGKNVAGVEDGFITIDGDETIDSDITNYLFYTDINNDGNYSYKYVSSYVINAGGKLTNEEWQKYAFRVIHRFTTREWTEQRYLYDIKIVSGESIDEYVRNALLEQGDTIPSNYNLRDEIAKITNVEKKEYALKVYNSNAPLMPEYDECISILSPRNIYVSVDLQGGIE